MMGDGQHEQYSELEDTTFDTILLFIYITALGMQLIAFYYLWLLRKQRNTRNQRTTMFSLCITETIFLVVWIFKFALALHDIQIGRVSLIIGHFLRYAVALQYILTMHHIAFDRFLEVYLHLKYKSLVTSRVSLITILVCWAITLVFASTLVIISQTVSNIHDVDRFAFFFFFATDVIFLTNSTGVYTYLYVKYRQMKSKTRKNNPFISKNKARFMAPFFIILTSLLFQVTASFLSMTNYLITSSKITYARQISLLLFGFGYVSDPLIYIILNPLVTNKIRCCSKQKYEMERHKSRTFSARSTSSNLNGTKPVQL